MRIRNRSTRPSPSPSLPPNAPLLILDPRHDHHDPPRKLSTSVNLESSPGTVATNYPGAVGVEGVGKAGNETRGSPKVTRQPQIDGSFPARPIIRLGGASRPAINPSTSTLGDGDAQAAPGSTCKVLPSGAVEKEERQDRARKLSARLLRKNEGASNVKIMEEPHLVSTSASKVPVKRRIPNHDELWKEDEELLAVKRKIIKIGKKRGKTTSKEQISQLVNHEGKEKEEALDADTTDQLIRNGKIGSNKTKAVVFIENSRCSRINGRGWRCSQQTLVGYSLCEHHLGKGRLKSMSSLRGRQSAPSLMPQADMINENNHMSLESPVDNIDDDQKPLIEAMKGHARKNIGSVKARSMSSLLGVNFAQYGSSPLISASNGGVAAGNINASKSECGASRMPG